MLTKYTFFKSFHEALADTDDATYGRIVRAMSEFAFEDKDPDLKGTDKMFFTLAKPLIDTAKKRSDAGRTGGLNGLGVIRNVGNKNAVKGEEQKQNKSKTKADMDKEVELGNGIGDKEVEKETKKKDMDYIKRFTPPTLDQVISYCHDRNNNVDPNKWFDYYTANGWMVGKNKMKDWKAAVRTWERPTFSDSRNNRNISANVRVETDKYGNSVAVYPDGFRAILGVGERINANDERVYNEHYPSVPRDAKPRPSDDYYYSKETDSWVAFG